MVYTVFVQICFATDYGWVTVILAPNDFCCHDVHGRLFWSIRLHRDISTRKTGIANVVITGIYNFLLK